MGATFLDEPAREALLELRRRGRVIVPSPAARRAIRQRAGLTVLELASAIDVSPAAVEAWESGRRRPSRGFAERYSEALSLLAEGTDGSEDP